MTIHHDKIAYGKLATTSEELSEDALLEMLTALNEADEDEENEKAEGQTTPDFLEHSLQKKQKSVK